MADFLLLMHKDAARAASDEDWGAYLGKLRAGGHHEGGSVIGPGVTMKKSGSAPDVTGHIGGFILIEAKDLDAARALVAGNPVFENGGTVEIRALPRSD